MAGVVAMEERWTPELQYDGPIGISTGKSRYEKKWKYKEMLWSQLIGRLSRSLETSETHVEYMKMPKADQDKIKDIGGFVAGYLKDGVRKTGTVEYRSAITLDADFPPEDLWSELLDNFDLNCAMVMYSTHKHSAAAPRLRLIMPLSRRVTAEEYEAIARKIAEKIGMAYFDQSTFQASRLMYWPSHSTDVEPAFNFYDAPFLDADAVLAEYPDWRDICVWPGAEVVKKRGTKQENPRAKTGVVGAFCRAYTVTEAIRRFLSEIYTETADENRWTYAPGSTAGGLVIYDDDLFAYSNHATDPAGGQECNAFDLVRVHKFGDNYKAMCDFAVRQPEVRVLLAEERKSQAAEDFPDEERDWREKLEYDKRGELLPTIANTELIIENDERIQGIWLNEISGMKEAEAELPWSRPGKDWRNVDSDQLFVWIAREYHFKVARSHFDAVLSAVADKRRFNPLRDYIDNLPAWDGIPRVESLLMDYLGAEDTPYVRAVTRVTLIGAVRRVYHPGCKFDTVLVLDGKPGIGKSTLLAKLGGEWFSDSLTMTDMRDKSGLEKLQGKWIMEIGEMQGSRKADTETIKSFISSQVDDYRPSYGKFVERHPRVTIICGTTNSTTGFLRDTTGNRRFLPVKVNGGAPLKVWDMTEETRAQIWAEAKVYEAKGEADYLGAEMTAAAEAAQREALEYDEREGEVMEYLDTLLPEDWYSRDAQSRVDYFQDNKHEAGTMRRDVVCTREIFCECWGKYKGAWKKQDSYEIAAIMARIPGWEQAAKRSRIPGYSLQRVFARVTS